MKRKRYIAFLMLIAFLCSSIPVSAATNIRFVSGKYVYKYSGNIYKVYFNKELVSCSMRPAIKRNGVYLIPYEYSLVSQGPKLSFKYIPSTKCISLSYGRKQAELYPDKKYMYANKLKRNLKVAPTRIIYGNSSFVAVPGEELCKALDFKFKVSESTKSIYITGGNPMSAYADIKSSAFKRMSPSQFIAKMGPIAQQDYHNTGILASVTLAQAILESGWGKSGLTQASNNLFGIKASSSGFSWKGSTWNRNQYVTVKTREEYGGRIVTITARFRKYASVADSIADHSAYLRYCKNGSRYRYAGITATKSYQRQLQIIQRGGYATSSNYVSQLCAVIKRYNLTKWDR